MLIYGLNKEGVYVVNRDDVLKDKPDYEDYGENEAKLSIEEMRKLGILRCGGCCSKKSNKNNKCSGCNKSKKCCKSK